MSEDKEQPKWTFERIREEIYEARTRLFVLTKVMESGNLSFEQHPEWVLVMRPLLKEIQDNTQKITAMMEPEKTS